MSMCPSLSVSSVASADSRRAGINKYCKFLLPQLTRNLITFWFLRRVRVSLLSSRDGASLLHAMVSREHGIVSARKLKTERTLCQSPLNCLDNLRLLERAVAGVGGSAAGADLQTSIGKEAATVNAFEVKRQTVHPR